MAIFNTGAFLQQCFAVHPLSLSFKIVIRPDKIGILCTNCNMRHRLTIGRIQSQLHDEALIDSGAAPQLNQCAETHSEALRVNGVKVEGDLVQLRCRECQRTYRINVSFFETYQP